jgi:hypothetical protein
MLSYKYSEKAKEDHKNAMMRRREDAKTRRREVFIYQAHVRLTLESHLSGKTLNTQ